MELPDNEVTRETEEIMDALTDLHRDPAKAYSTEKYNAAYSAIHALLTEIAEREKP